MSPLWRLLQDARLLAWRLTHISTLSASALPNGALRGSDGDIELVPPSASIRSVLQADADQQRPGAPETWQSASARGGAAALHDLPSICHLAHRQRLVHAWQARSSSGGERMLRQSQCGIGDSVGSTRDARSSCRQLHSRTSAGGTSQGGGGGTAGRGQALRRLHEAPTGTGPSAKAAGAPAAAPPTWLDRYCPPSLLPFAHLIRLDKPIGAHHAIFAPSGVVRIVHKDWAQGRGQHHG